MQMEMGRSRRLGGWENWEAVWEGRGRGNTSLGLWDVGRVSPHSLGSGC